MKKTIGKMPVPATRCDWKMVWMERSPEGKNKHIRGCTGRAGYRRNDKFREPCPSCGMPVRITSGMVETRG